MTDANDKVTEDLLGHVRSIVKKKGQNVEPQTILVSNGMLDSLDLLDLIEFIERRFSVKLSNEDMDPQLFETVESLANMVRRKTGAASNGDAQA